MLKKFLACLLGALALSAAAVGAPAHAADSNIAVAGVVGKSEGSPVAVINPNQQLVQFGCAGVATLVAASTSVDDCDLYANGSYVTSAPSISLSGQAAATAAVATTSIGARLTVCYRVSARPVLGPGVSASGCTTVNTVVAA